VHDVLPLQSGPPFWSQSVPRTDLVTIRPISRDLPGRIWVCPKSCLHGGRPCRAGRCPKPPGQLASLGVSRTGPPPAGQLANLDVSSKPPASWPTGRSPRVPNHPANWPVCGTERHLTPRRTLRTGERPGQPEPTSAGRAPQVPRVDWRVILKARHGPRGARPSTAPLQAPGAAGALDGEVLTNKSSQGRADAQRLVATRLLDRVHDPLGHFSRLQRIYPRAR
jgi:hypothetical protein